MAFMSLMHWHATGSFEQATKDMIRRFRLSLRRCIEFGSSWFALQHYTCRPTVDNVVCIDVGIKWSVGVDAYYPYVTGCRK